ncbi:hypothetical protein ACFWZT_27500, partial [Streptomyces alboflavus]
RGRWVASRGAPGPPLHRKGGGGRPPPPPPRYTLSASTADAYAAAGFTAIVQDVILGEELKRYVDLVRTRPLHVIVLAPTPSAVTEREASRGKTGYGEWTVEALDEGMRATTPRIGLWLDSSELTVDQTVDAILGRLREASVT